MRSASSVLFLLVGLSPSLWGEERVRLLVQSSPLAGVRYYAAAEVGHELRVGDRLELVRERDNPHDANAIAVSWRSRKLGYAARRDRGLHRVTV
jgi:hypothetical protein